MNENHQERLSLNPVTRKSTPGSRPRTAPAMGKTTQTSLRNRRIAAKMALFGAMSLTSYLVLFSNEALVTQTFTRGGWFAAFPVLTAFFFSFVHGAFASNLISFLGIEPKRS
ncbi:MAG: hypothetical protein N839_0014555 [Desulfofustis sp. PB-SRB1]|jgi:anti-sigma factor RsiW|nr:hypothetical protein [Desulfofustis sp. PB-SRB1]MBM1003615.1 hypothetical protein [Desulfofustis sp. PB-SRB1]HBH29785.1 hypothetical protein [Desulfofustis sp.]HBH32734.1 hypothetical protein [Desulfofustis sp.]